MIFIWHNVQVQYIVHAVKIQRNHIEYMYMQEVSEILSSELSDITDDIHYIWK